MKIQTMDPRQSIHMDDLIGVFNRLASQLVGSTPTRLAGSRALEYSVHSGALVIHHVNAWMTNGFRVTIKDRIVPLPPPADEQIPIRIGFESRQSPVRDGSTLEQDTFDVRLLSCDDDSPLGSVLIGHCQSGNFEPCTVAADHCDSCEANSDWLTSIQRSAETMDEQLLRIARWAHAGQSPALIWNAIMAPSYYALASLRSHRATNAPDEVLVSVREVVEQLRRISSRAAYAGSDATSRLWQDALRVLDGVVQSVGIQQDLHQRCRDAMLLCDAACAGLTNVLSNLGAEAGLPETLYQHGKLYRKIRSISLQTMSTSDGRAVLSCECPDTPAGCVMVLKWSSSVEFGDVKFFNLTPKGNQAQRSGELYLDQVAAGDIHFLTGISTRDAHLEVPQELAMPDAALYEIVVSGAD